MPCSLVSVLLLRLFQQHGALCHVQFHVSFSPPFLAGSFAETFNNTIVLYQQPLKLYFKNTIVPYQLPLRLALRKKAVTLPRNTRVFSQREYHYSTNTNVFTV